MDRDHTGKLKKEKRISASLLSYPADTGILFFFCLYSRSGFCRLLFYRSLRSNRALAGDSTGRTLLGTNAAILTVLVHGSEIIYDVNCIKWTILLAETAGNAADRAGILNGFTFKMVLACNDVLLLVWNEVDDVLRTSLNAGATGNTLLLINNSNAVNDVDGIKLTSLYARTISAT